MKNKIFCLPKFQEPAGTLPTNFVPGTIIPDLNKTSAIEQFQFKQNSPLYQFIDTVNSEEGKRNQQYSGNYYYTPTKNNSNPHWEFIRSEEPLQPMEQEIASYTPYTGDVAEFTQIGKDILQGNLGSAALGASLLAFPGNWRKISDNIKSLFKRNNTPIQNLENVLQNRGNTLLRQRLQSGAAERVGYKKRLYKDFENLKIMDAKDYDPVVKITSEAPTSAVTIDRNLSESHIRMNPDDLKSKSFNNIESISSMYDHELTHLLDNIFRSPEGNWKDISSWWPSIEQIEPLFKSWAENVVKNQNLDINNSEGQKLYTSMMSWFNNELYSYLSKATEQVARGVQIKNAAGITDGKRIFTPEEVKEMWENYRQKSMDEKLMNNNMSQTYKLINSNGKWKEYTDWFNASVPAIIPIGLSANFVGNNNSKTENNYE